MGLLNILLYHRIATIKDDYNLLSVTPENFELQIKYLKNNYQIIHIEDDWNKIDKPSVIITFDDGYEDAYTTILPILNKYQIPATFFITTGCMTSGNELWTDAIIRLILTNQQYRNTFTLDDKTYGYTWNTETLDERYHLYKVMRYLFQRANKKERENWLTQLIKWSGFNEWETFIPRKDRRFLNPWQCNLLANNNLVTIGAHTINHPSLSKQSNQAQRDEIYMSKVYLEEICQKEIKYFSYPFGGYGDYSNYTINLIKELGFKKAFSSFSGEITTDTDMFQIPRYLVRNWHLEEFQSRLKSLFINTVYKAKQLNNFQIEYFGTQDRDSIIYNSNQPIILWGTGIRGMNILKRLKYVEIYKNFIGFGDNNPQKWGNQIEGMPVFSTDYIQTNFKDAIIIIGSSYEREIINQLTNLGLRHLHLYID